MARVKELYIGDVNIFDVFYPVGSIYETSDIDFNPNESFSGTWTRIKGKVLVGVDENDSIFASSKLTGGEKTHTLTINEMPSHNHTLTNNIIDGASMGGTENRFVLCIGGGDNLSGYYMINNQGGGEHTTTFNLTILYTFGKELLKNLFQFINERIKFLLSNYKNL